MKNVVNYYYDLFPDEIHQIDKKIFFKIDNVEYVFMQFVNDFSKLEKIEYILNGLNYYNITYNQPIKNNVGSILTYIRNNPYILIKINVNKKENIILSDIILFHNYTKNVINDKINLESLSQVWMNKIDYFEYQVSQFGIKFPIIRHSFNYFVGMAENAISILNTILKKEIVGTISHFRISRKYKISDLYNPLNFVIDSRIRDISEYFKEKMFFYDIFDELVYYFNYNYFENDEIVLFLARLLFPTFYFDICEEIMIDNNDEYLKLIISKINFFELNIKKVYKFLKSNYYVPEISWLLF